MRSVSCGCSLRSFHASVLPSVFIIISAQQLRVSSFISASNQLGAEREDASNFVSLGAVLGGCL